MVRSRIDHLYGIKYNKRAIHKTLKHKPTILIYPSNVEFVPTEDLTKVIRWSDKYLKGRVVKVLSKKRFLLEDGGIQPFKSTLIRLIDIDHLLGDSIPIPYIPLGYTDNITRS